jgi:UDPglucose 6-dehydrogenase
MNEEAEITVYDPKVSEERIYADLDYLNTRSPVENRKRLKVVNSPYDACANAHAIAILTEWDEFKEYDWEKIYDSVIKPAFVFDGRKLLNGLSMKEMGFEYFSVGISCNNLS